MRWEDGRRIDNVEDRRGMGAPAMVGGGIGLVGVILAVVVALMGGDPMVVLQQMGGSGALSPGPVVVNPRQAPSPQQDRLNAASRIGDDTLQRQSSGRIRPDSFTHGSSAQRQRWFARGLQSGSMEVCDTFSGTI